LAAIKSGRLPPPSDLPSFDTMKEIVGYPEYYKEEERYATNVSSPTPYNRPSGYFYALVLNPCHRLLLSCICKIFGFGAIQN
jgi:hypothetical protein